MPKPTPFTTPIDMPLALARLVPTAEYHWKGNGWGIYADIGDWRSPDIAKPTEAEVYGEWDKYLAEQVQVDKQAAAASSQLEALLQGADGLTVEHLEKLPLEQIRSLLAAILYRMGMIAPDGSVALTAPSSKLASGVSDKHIGSV